MRDRVPELNNSVAQVMATERLLAKNKDRLEAQVVDFDSKIKAAIKLSRDDMATAYIGQLQQAQLDLQKMNAKVEAGRVELARVMGIILPTDSIGQTCFPFLLGILRDRFGNYIGGLALVIALAFGGALAVALLPGRTG